MKKFRIAAFMLAAAMSISAASCSSKKTSTETAKTAEVSDADAVPNGELPKPTKYADREDTTEFDSMIGKEIEANDTVFTLNSIIEGCRTDIGERYIYFNVTIKNNTTLAYELNPLNNFYLEMPDGEERSTDIITQIYATKHFPKVNQDYINVPSKGEFTGYIAGFVLKDGEDDFNFCFFPTKEVLTDRRNVIKCPITAADMSKDPSVME